MRSAFIFIELNVVRHIVSIVLSEIKTFVCICTSSRNDLVHLSVCLSLLPPNCHMGWHPLLLWHVPPFWTTRHITGQNVTFLGFNSTFITRKMDTAFNGRTSGSGRGLRVHRTSWTRSGVGRQPKESCRTGSGCPLSPFWKPHPHLRGGRKKMFLKNLTRLINWQFVLSWSTYTSDSTPPGIWRWPGGWLEGIKNGI